MIDDDVVRLLHKEEYVGHSLSLRKVAAKVGISGQALHDRFKALGLPTRTLNFATEESVSVDELLGEEGRAA